MAGKAREKVLQEYDHSSVTRLLEAVYAREYNMRLRPLP